MTDEIVKVKKEDLEKIINANTEAYNLLDEARANANDVLDRIKSAFNALEDAPNELSDIVVEDDGEN